jgi:vancomycin resistance protein YoaR
VSNKFIILIFALVSGMSFYVFDLWQHDILSTQLHAAAHEYNLPVDYESSATKGIKETLSSGFVLVDINNILGVPSDVLVSWISEYDITGVSNSQLRPDTNAIREYLIDISPAVNTLPYDGELAMLHGILIETVPSQPGRYLLIDETSDEIVNALNHGSEGALISVREVPARISVANARTLGINTLIGVGKTSLSGSPSYRNHNIKMGSEKLESTILAPGEEFSFNDTMSKNTASAGYLPASIIKNGKLVKEYGGGLCQVSTTLYRAAMAAGLEITERRSHSLQVSYYTPQGFDATIYPGIIDRQ